MTADPSLLIDLLTGLHPHGAPPEEIGTAPVEPEELIALLAAARVAPSADNAQTWRFVVVQSPEARADLSLAMPEPLQEATRRSPVTIVACGLPWVLTHTRREQPFVLIDVPIALTQLLLAAQELKLRYAWTLVLDEARVRENLGIPQEVRIIGAVTVSRAGC